MEQIQTYVKKNIQRSIERGIIFSKWMIVSSIIGLLVGGLATLFHFSVDYVTQVRIQHPNSIYLMPIAGILIVFLYRKVQTSQELSTNLVLQSIRSTEKLPIIMAPLIFVSTVLTHLVGGSSGREGAALQLGGSVASFIGKLFHMEEGDLRIITMCGMTAAFSALFGTPIGATIFAMEVISVGVMYYVALVPCIVAALIASGLAHYCGISSHFHSINLVASFDILYLGEITILGILCALLSVLFCKVLHLAQQGYSKYIKNEYIRIIAASFIIILLTNLLNTRDYLGLGTPIIQKALAGEAVWNACLLKIIFTAIILGAGFKGGEIIPCFFVGATFGATIGPLLGLSPSLSAELGMIALFCGVTNCPITSFILAIEIFGSNSRIYFMLIIAITYMLSGYSGLYKQQKIMYSKFKPEFRNELTQ